MNPTADQRLSAEGGPRVALTDHPTHSATTEGGWPAVLFGLPFSAAGIWVILASRGVIRGTLYAPPWVVTVTGSMFLFAGLSMLIHGVRGILIKARYRRAAARHPGQPWLYDFHWRPDGITYSAFKAMLFPLLAALIWTAMLVPLYWIALNVHGALLVFIAVPALFSLIVAVLWYRWAARFLDLLRMATPACATILSRIFLVEPCTHVSPPLATSQISRVLR